MNSISINRENADQAWLAAATNLLESGELQSSRLGITKEIRHVLIEIRNPLDRVVFSRPINPAFALAEVVWILAGANDSEFVRFWNPRLKRFLDDDKTRFHGAYGYRLGSSPDLSSLATLKLRKKRLGEQHAMDQLLFAVNALRHMPESRQVVLQIWNKDLDLPDPHPRSLDVPCNLTGHLLVRNGKLEWTQVMRSADIVWGLPYNIIQWSTLQEIVAGWLGLDVGSYTHLIDSLHVYEKHWKPLERWIESSSSSSHALPETLRISNYEKWNLMFSRLVDLAIELTRIQVPSDALSVLDRSKDFPAGYRQWIVLLAVDALRRRGFRDIAREMVWESGEYWATSWLSWDESRSKAEGTSD